MPDYGKIIDSHTVRFERLLPGPIERVWEYLTKSESLVTWLGETDMDLRVGGQIGVRFDTSKGSGIIRGQITCYEPMRLLEYTWVAVSGDGKPPDTSAPDSIVSFDLEARGDQVLLVLTHRRLLTDFLSKVGAGWHALLDGLAARLGSQETEPFFPMFNRHLPRYEQVASALAAKAQST